MGYPVRLAFGQADCWTCLIRGVILLNENDELRIAIFKDRLQHAQSLVRKHVEPGISLVDELIAERHKGRDKCKVVGLSPLDRRQFLPDDQS